MSIDLSEILVIGVSTRALFDLEKENQVFEIEGIEGYRKYQLENEDQTLKPGTAFYLIQSLLELNKQANKRIVEVIVMSRNSPETGVRILNTLKKFELDISRVALS
ncbi:MAG: 5'-nucleotidase, partial [Saprospiraceae bacterium]